MAVSTDEACDVPGDEKGLLSDPTRTNELTAARMQGTLWIAA